MNHHRARKPLDQPALSPRRGFTLIELLVVVSIIAILAALLIPAISMARQAAVKTKCLSSLRQQGMAIQGYTMDWNGFIPSMDMPIGGGRSAKWFVLLAPYATEQEVDWNPNMPENSVFWSCMNFTDVSDRGDGSQNWRTGYGLNLSPHWGNWNGYPNANLAQVTSNWTRYNPDKPWMIRDFMLEEVTHPTQRLLVSDSMNYHVFQDREYWGNADRLPYQRHPGGGKDGIVNVLCWDLHVEPMKRNHAFWAFKDPRKVPD